MKILFIITKSEVGGAQKFVSEQMKMLQKENIASYLVTNKVGWLSNKVSSIAEDILYDMRIEKKTSLTFISILVSYIKENSIDVVVCNSANGGMYGRLATFLTKAKSVYVSHGWSSIYNGGRWSYFLNRVEQFLAYIGDTVLCISENDFNAAISFIKVPVHKCILINNCIYPVSEYVRDQYLPRKTIKILFLGRLSHPKRPDLLIESIKNLKNVHLSIIGYGDYYQSLKIKIEQENITNVLLKGEIVNFDLFQEYDIFTLISESEGLPMSAIEAMSCSLPLVLSDIGGCRPLINENGELVKNDIMSIQNGIKKCILRIEKYSKKSKEIFEKKYSLHPNKEKYIELYTSVLLNKPLR